MAMAPDRKAERPIAHLAGFKGILQVDGYGGCRVLAERGAAQLAFCWSHVRRRFYELAAAGSAPIASEALERIAVLFAIERRFAAAASPSDVPRARPGAGQSLMSSNPGSLNLAAAGLRHIATSPAPKFDQALSECRTAEGPTDVKWHPCLSQCRAPLSPNQMCDKLGTLPL